MWCKPAPHQGVKKQIKSLSKVPKRLHCSIIKVDKCRTAWQVLIPLRVRTAVTGCCWRWWRWRKRWWWAWWGEGGGGGREEAEPRLSTEEDLSIQRRLWEVLGIWWEEREEWASQGSIAGRGFWLLTCILRGELAPCATLSGLKG